MYYSAEYSGCRDPTVGPKSLTLFLSTLYCERVLNNFIASKWIATLISPSLMCNSLPTNPLCILNLLLIIPSVHSTYFIIFASISKLFFKLKVLLHRQFFAHSSVIELFSSFYLSGMIWRQWGQICQFYANLFTFKRQICDQN